MTDLKLAAAGNSETTVTVGCAIEANAAPQFGAIAFGGLSHVDGQTPAVFPFLRNAELSHPDIDLSPSQMGTRNP